MKQTSIQYQHQKTHGEKNGEMVIMHTMIEYDPKMFGKKC